MWHPQDYKKDLVEFNRIVEKYNMPKFVNNCEGKTIRTYYEDDHLFVLIFEDNTIQVLYTETDENSIDVLDMNSFNKELGFDVYFCDIFGEYRDAWLEWKKYDNEQCEQYQKSQRDNRYSQYLKLKDEFEGEE